MKPDPTAELAFKNLQHPSQSLLAFETEIQEQRLAKQMKPPAAAAD
jgi:hypothetical protein